MGRKRTIEVDWVQVKNEFITTDIALTELSRKHKLNYNYCRKHRKEEKWDKERAAWRKERNAAEKEAVLEEAKKQAVERFRTSEAIRADHHQLANAMFNRVRDVFLDKQGKPRVRRGQATARNLKDFVEVMKGTYAMEMGTAGHETMPESINLNARVLHAGVSADQIQQMPDSDLDQIFEVAARTKQLPAKKEEE